MKHNSVRDRPFSPVPRLKAEKQFWSQQAENPWVLYRSSLAGDLLTAEQERELAQRIERAREEQKKKTPNLAILGQGKEATDQLVRANLRLVAHIARGLLQERATSASVDLLDLLQEGSLGLMKAIEGYNWRLGRFSTYATWWIRQAIERAYENGSTTLRLPSWQQTNLHALKQARRAYLNRYGDEPPVDYLAQATGRTREQVMELLRAAEHPVSLEAEMYGHSGELTLGDALPDEELRVDEEVLHAVQASELRHALRPLLQDILTQRERQVVWLRFGLDGAARTPKEVGRELGISRERVRQLEVTAAKKIRACPLVRELYNDLIRSTGAQ